MADEREVEVPPSLVIPDKIYWKPEEWDKLLPTEAGFCNDFVLYTRGIESPTAFNFWASLFITSLALGRDAFLKWFPSPMFFNLYLFFVGYPSVVKKSTAIKLATSIYEGARELSPTKIDKEIMPQIILNKATPESIAHRLRPHEEMIIESDDTVHNIQVNSAGGIIAHELSTLLDQKEYNKGMVEMLNQLYDCDDYAEVSTKSRGVEPLTEVYVCVFGGATPRSIAYSMPPSAFEDGFMSRSIVVFIKLPTRMFYKPIPYPLGDETDLAERLAWIRRNKVGEYTFSDEADEYCANLYQDIRVQLVDDIKVEKHEMSYRYDTVLRKVSCLLRAQAYSPSRVVTLDDIKQAKLLIDDCMVNSHEAMDQARHNGTAYSKAYWMISKRIEENHIITRIKLQQSISKYYSADVMDKILKALQEEGKVKVTASTQKTKTKYTWQKT